MLVGVERGDYCAELWRFGSDRIWKNSSLKTEVYFK